MDNLEFLKEKHAKMLDVMCEISGLDENNWRAPPARIELDNGSYFAPGSFGNSPGIKIRDSDSLVYKELTLAHETGHYIHYLCHNAHRDKHWCGTPDTFREAVAEFLAMCYFDKTEGIEHFLNGRARNFYNQISKEYRPRDDFYVAVKNLYVSIPNIKRREQLCRDLFLLTYGEVKWWGFGENGHFEFRHDYKAYDKLKVNKKVREKLNNLKTLGDKVFGKY